MNNLHVSINEHDKRTILSAIVTMALVGQKQTSYNGSKRSDVENDSFTILFTSFFMVLDQPLPSACKRPKDEQEDNVI